MLFSVVDPKSYHYVKDYWTPEIRHHLPHSTIILIGTKCDLRDDPSVLQELYRVGEKPITTKEGRKMMKELGFSAYHEINVWEESTYEDLVKNSMITYNEHYQRTRYIPSKKCNIL
eukprot:TRINITY_DN4629_c0_g1_i2.p1 TRINITY_DN4629_c0_g1~~TRINITY_DN4629_c0_g1_i2.p1  ORF type:complete len:116 (-),score=20.70 TRINITY_DN4629_c0_g1_i2:32-379(-)